MENSNIQGKIRGVIYSIFAIIIGLILIRILLKLVGAQTSNELVREFYNLTDIFVNPWKNIYPSIEPRNSNLIVEIYSIIALIFYLILSIVTSKSAASPFEDTRKQAIMEIVDSLFKVSEFLLISRFVFKITDANPLTPFVELIYKASNIVYTPFEGILPSFSILGATIEITTVLALIIIIILDIITEQFLFNLLSAIFPDNMKNKQNKPPTYNHNQKQPQPVQSININIPQNPGQPPTYIDQRSVNLQPPYQNPQNQPQQRGYLQQPGKTQAPRAGGPPES